MKGISDKAEIVTGLEDSGNGGLNQAFLLIQHKTGASILRHLMRKSLGSEVLRVTSFATKVESAVQFLTKITSFSA
jgi:hypothetical protein